jgi:hypothetical protein
MSKIVRRRKSFGPILGLLLGASFLALGSRPAAAQARNEWLGQRVITKSGAELRIGYTIVASEKPGSENRGGRRMDACVFRVEHVNGPWLWLQDEKSGTAGWVTADWIVPFDRYKRRERSGIHETWAHLAREEGIPSRGRRLR